jgi:hypothetical protein
VSESAIVCQNTLAVAGPRCRTTEAHPSRTHDGLPSDHLHLCPSQHRTRRLTLGVLPCGQQFLDAFTTVFDMPLHLRRVNQLPNCLPRAGPVLLHDPHEFRGVEIACQEAGRRFSDGGSRFGVACKIIQMSGCALGAGTSLADSAGHAYAATELLHTLHST